MSEQREIHDMSKVLPDHAKPFWLMRQSAWSFYSWESIGAYATYELAQHARREILDNP